MYNKDSRIYFLDNPYPNGHKLKEFDWSIRLIPSKGLWFDLHLETEDYYAEDESDDETDPESDWMAKNVWGNYHSCRLSSNYWHAGGFLGGTEDNKFDFREGSKNHFHVDQLPRPDNFDINEDPVFCIYLLGHDDCADHKIVFHKNDNEKFTIKWQGKIALSYSGDYDFDYNFSSAITGIKIPEILCPSSLTNVEIEALLSKCSIGYEDLKIVKLENEENIDITSNTAMADSEVKERIKVKSNFWNKLKRLWS